VVASIIWLAGWLCYVWATCKPVATSNQLYCYTNVFDDWMKQVPLMFLDYVSIVSTGLVIPIAALVIGAGLLWAVEGFRR
jgi:hypothetical protein